MKSDRGVQAAKVALFVLGLVPLVLLIRYAATDSLGANPIEAIERYTGWWTLTLLFVTLAATPIRRLTGWNAVARVRRMLGLFTFFWACLHLIAYVGLDQFFAWRDIVKDVAKRPYVTVGFATFLLLTALALTSSDDMVRRLGGARWKKLHRLVYVAAVGGVLHFWWLVKADIAEPLAFASILTLLLAVRLRRSARRDALADAPRAPASRRAA